MQFNCIRLPNNDSLQVHDHPGVRKIGHNPHRDEDFFSDIHRSYHLMKELASVSQELAHLETNDNHENWHT